MSNSASFNLLKFVEHRPALSINRIYGVVLLVIVLMLSYFLYQVQKLHETIEVVAALEKNIQQNKQLMQPLLSQGENNPLMGVLPTNFFGNEQGFYPEFEALSHLQIKGLWLTEVTISRNPNFIRIAGAMDLPEKINSLLQQLAAQPVFKTVRFIGIDVNKGLIDVPEQYKNELKRFKIPSFYHFVIQTTALDVQEARS